MALNGKYIEIPRIIDGVYRDFGWTHEINWIDCIEWVGECLDLIAAPQQYVQRMTDGNEALNHPCPLIVKNYRASLPCDLLYITQVKDKDTGVPLRHSGDSFHKNIPKMEENLGSSITTSNIGNFSSPFIASQSKLKDTGATDLTYTTNDCYIFTNYEEGELVVSYTAFPTDEEGLPLVPDDQAFVQAVKHYIAEKIGQKMFIQGKMAQGIFQHLQKERDWYVGKANSRAHMPTIDQMETWKNEFVRLIPNINHHSNGFKNLGNQQQRINHNSI
jgi:hypothetical protein